MRIGRRVCLGVIAFICWSWLQAIGPSLASGQDNTEQKLGDFQGFAFTISASTEQAGSVFMAGHRFISCVDRSTGKTQWSVPIPGGTVDSPLLTVGDVVVYSGGGGNFILYGLDAQSGHLRWRLQHKSTVIATDGQRLFVNEVPGKSVLALWPGSGKKIWSFKQVGPNTIGQMLYYRRNLFTNYDVLDPVNGKLIRLIPSEPRALAAAPGMLFFGIQSGSIQAMTISTGEIRWSVNGPAGMNVIALRANNDYVAAMFYEGYEFAAKRGVLRVYLNSNGRLLWEFPLRAEKRGLQPNPVSLSSTFLYTSEPLDSGLGSRVTALDLRSGKTTWTYDESAGTDGPPVLVGNELYITAGDRNLLILDAKTGRKLRMIPSPDLNR